MTIEESIERWEKYLEKITALRSEVVNDIQNDNHVNAVDAVTLACLQNQLDSTMSTADLIGRMLSALYEESRRLSK